MKNLAHIMKTIKAISTILSVLLLIGAFILGDSLDLQEKISALFIKIRDKARGN
jgi:hypothetical protein